jgi:hypothetical protein
MQPVEIDSPMARRGTPAGRLQVRSGRTLRWLPAIVLGFVAVRPTRAQRSRYEAPRETGIDLPAAVPRLREIQRRSRLKGRAPAPWERGAYHGAGATLPRYQLPILFDFRRERDEYFLRTGERTHLASPAIAEKLNRNGGR